ncbi:hypothetical protein D3C81_2201760 [compost metagenome]
MIGNGDEGVVERTDAVRGSFVHTDHDVDVVSGGGVGQLGDFRPRDLDRCPRQFFKPGTGLYRVGNPAPVGIPRHEYFRERD